MTPQQEANVLLAQWWANKHLPPEKRLPPPTRPIQHHSEE